MYEEIVTESEKGSFIPLVFTTSGEMGPLCSVLVKRLSEKITESHSEALYQVTNNIRTRLRFALLRSTLVALHRVRVIKRQIYSNIESITFNLIPHKNGYEVP